MKLCGLMTSAFLVLCTLVAGSLPAHSATYQVLHRFGDADGIFPSANGISPYGLIADSAGNLYGITLYGGTTPGGCLCGTIFELSPPAAAGGAWTETTLYSFTGGAEGTYPQPYLTMDKDGALYGDMARGPDGSCNGSSNDCGTVFKLEPPKSSGAKWTFQLLHTFKATDTGVSPTTQLVIDSKGAVYGTTSNGLVSVSCTDCGTIFKLTPPVAGATVWSYNIIHTFGDPVNGSAPGGPLVMDSAGALYGTTFEGGGQAEDGVLFRLAPSAGQEPWSYSVLHTFQNNGFGVDVLAFGQGGVLYGSDNIGGASCTNNANGYFGCGAIFSLTPPKTSQGTWSYSILHTFSYSATGANPYGLVLDSSGTIYGAAGYGGLGSCQSGCGGVFAMSPPAKGGKLWSYSLLQGIGHPVNGANPSGTIVEGSAKVLYGTTQYGGDSTCKNGQSSEGVAPGCGVVYQVTQ